MLPKRIFPVLVVLLFILSSCGLSQPVRPPSPTPPAALPTFHTAPTETAALTRSPSSTPKPTAIPAAVVASVTASPTLDTSRATVKLQKADVWDDPANENSYWHRQTQLITGEQVVVLAVKGDWAQVIAVMQPSSKNERGYPGWVRNSALSDGWDQMGRYLVVTARSTNAYKNPDLTSARLMRLYFDTRLPVSSRQADFMQATLPDGRTAWLPMKDITLAGQNKATNLSLPGSLLELARTLVGAPYLWGGTTPDSPDCSGFTYRLFHAAGITLARDANDQALQGEGVSYNGKKAGDLIFYLDAAGGPVTHVGLYMGNNQIMDANPWLGLSIHPVSDMQKWYVFYSVRRVIQP